MMHRVVSFRSRLTTDVTNRVYMSAMQAITFEDPLEIIIMIIEDRYFTLQLSWYRLPNTGLRLQRAVTNHRYVVPRRKVVCSGGCGTCCRRPRAQPSLRTGSEREATSSEIERDATSSGIQSFVTSSGIQSFATCSGIRSERNMDGSQALSPSV